MDFSTWSPSHTILLLGMILSTIITAVVQVKLLLHRVKCLETQMDKTNNRNVLTYTTIYCGKKIK